MSNLSVKSLWIYGVVIAAYLGVAVSYSKLYLIHLFLGLGPFFFYQSLRSKLLIKDFIQKNWIFLFWLGYLGLSTLWAEQPRSALSYMIMVILGVLTALSISLEKGNTKTIFKILGWLSVISLILGILESFTSFRYPISKYSKLLPYFKKAIIETDASVPYPTSFFWTANNFALMLLISLPFYSLLKKRWVEIVLWLVSILLILKASSRGILAIAGLYFCFRLGALLLNGKNKKKIILTFFAALLIFLPVTYKSLSEDNILELISVKDVIHKQITFYTTMIMDENPNPQPRTRREEMLFHTLNLWKEHKFFGSGPGQLQGKSASFNGAPLDLATPHHYWAELLCYGGIFFISVLFFGFFTILRRLWKLSSTQSKVAFEALILFIIAAPASSTLVYFFPAWLFLGLINKMSYEKFEN